MKVINDKKRLLFTLKEKTSGPLVVAPEELILVDESLNQTTPIDPRPYKVYTALLTQTGTDAPVATVLENTLGGEIVWTRDEGGYYLGTLVNAFPLDKTTYFVASWYMSITNRIFLYKSDIDSFVLETYDEGLNSDDILEDVSVEIRVYN